MPVCLFGNFSCHQDGHLHKMDRMTDSTDTARTLAAEWDDRYTGLQSYLAQVMPNEVLSPYLDRLIPGSALDIGCGAGADAIALATRGWNVTAVDVSAVALEYGAARAREAAVTVTWAQGTLEEFAVPTPGFDLVTAVYPALRHTPDRLAEKALLAAVAPGGTLLVVHHADVDVEKARSFGFEPTDFLSHDDLVGILDDGWEVHVDRRIARERPVGVDGQHTHDDVVCARRHVTGRRATAATG